MTPERRAAIDLAFQRLRETPEGKAAIAALDNLQNMANGEFRLLQEAVMATPEFREIQRLHRTNN